MYNTLMKEKTRTANVKYKHTCTTEQIWNPVIHMLQQWNNDYYSQIVGYILNFSSVCWIMIYHSNYLQGPIVSQKQ